MRNLLMRLAAALKWNPNDTTINVRLDQLTADLTQKLDQLHRDLQKSLDNQTTAVQIRLDQLIPDSGLTQDQPSQSAAVNAGLNEHLSKSSADVKSDVIADVELIERFSRDWQANARFYRETLDDLRSAARRLRLVLQRSSANRSALSNGEIQRLRNVEEEIACLARQPLFFPEMFHGATLLPDGSFSPLNPGERLHFRASGLLGKEDRVAVAEIYRRISQNRKLPLRVVEIGSAVGRGSTRIAGEFVKQSGGTLYCIDPWERSMYYIFLANIRIFELEGTVVPIRSPSVDAAAMFDDGSLDAVFVDGSHIYPNVLADIDAYLPKIRKNGILFGHDLHDVPSRFDRRELLSIASKNNAEANYTNSRGEVQRVDVHPGVILAVQDRFSDEIELFPGSVVWAKQI